MPAAVGSLISGADRRKSGPEGSVMANGRKQAEAAAARVLRALEFTPGKEDLQAVTEILEIALDDVAREHEKREHKRIAEMQASAHAHLSRLLNASPAVIY